MNERIYHLARRVREDGAVSAWCYASNRPINLKRASWVLETSRATCSRCVAAFRAAKGPNATSVLAQVRDL